MRNPSIETLLGNLSIEEFLADYWQKKPLLIRNAFPNFESPIDSDELAGLSLESDIESRIVIEDGKSTYWELLNGPFTEADYEQLPPDKWTLLIQSADHWVPEVRELLEYFRFLPNWRVDDVMISFAVDGGSVGPHFDHYDVFLLQGAGQRHWQVGAPSSADSPLDRTTPLKILQEFYPEEEWVLSPGDMLYLPPLYSHWGTARGDCITYSIGFRSINHTDLLTSYSQTAIEQLAEFQRYTDANRLTQNHPGEINEKDIEALQATLQELVNDKSLIARSIGRFSTEPKYPEVMDSHRDDIERVDSWGELAELIKDSTTMARHEASRFAYAKVDDLIELYVDGDDICCTPTILPLLQLLCQEYLTPVEELKPHCDNDSARELLINLFNMGAIYFE